MRKIKCRYYIIMWFIPVILLAVHMYFRECYPFGQNTILLGDANAQYYWFEDLLLDKLKKGEFILFSWNAGMGFEFYQNFFYYLGSPFNILAMIIGMWDLEIGVAVTVAAQIGMCGVTMLYYLVHTKRNVMEKGMINTFMCMVFALAYSTCNYFLAYQYNYIWLISLMLAPLVMLGVERMVDGEGSVYYIIVLSLTFITNFYFSWFICILSFGWYIDYGHGNVKQVCRMTIRYFVSSFLSAVIAGFVLVPCLISVSGRIANTDNVRVTFDKIGNIADFLQSFFWNSTIYQGGKYIYTNNNYVGVFVLMLVVVYICQGSIPIFKRLKRLAEIFLLSIVLNSSVGSYIFHGLTIPNSLHNRYAFILSLLLIVTAFELLVEIKDFGWRALIAVVIAGTILVIYALFKNSDIGTISSYLVTISILIYMCVCLVLFGMKSIGKKALIINVIIVGCLELISNYYLVSVDEGDGAVDRGI